MAGELEPYGQGLARPDPDLSSELREAILEATRILDAALPRGLKLDLRIADDTETLLSYAGTRPTATVVPTIRNIDLELSGRAADFISPWGLVEQNLTVEGRIYPNDAGQLQLALVEWRNKTSAPYWSDWQR